MLSILTCLTFYLPTESGEKVSLGLTVLLAFSVFMLLIAEAMPATSDSVPLIGKLSFLEKQNISSKFSFSFLLGIYFTLVMSLTSLSVLLAVVLLNVHLYGSALKPVPSRLRGILFYRVAPFLRVKLHRGARCENQKNARQSTVMTPRRATTIYNAVFLNENELLSNGQQQQHTFQSTTINENNLNSDSSSISNVQSSSQSLGECKRLLTELNRLVLRPTEVHEEETIVRDWQNVALIMDRCLFFLYLFLTTLLTVGTLVLAPLLKFVPKAPNYYQLNITRD
jgi:nicotinic acetylcholine receptor